MTRLSLDGLLVQKGPAPPIETILLDLDDTLYYSPEMSRRVAKNIQEYMVEYLGVGREEVVELSRELYYEFGTTLAGLVKRGYEIDFDHWHNTVHGTLPYESFLKPDPALRHMLNAIPVPKYIFTNADIKHAKKCLELLDLMDCFQEIVCFESIMATVPKGHDVICKPSRRAMDAALRMVGGNVSSTIFFDDSVRNIASAHAMGVYSVLVNPQRIDCACHVHIHSIHQVPHQLPWLTSVGDGRPPEDIGLASPRRVAEAEVLSEEQKSSLSVQA